MTFRPTRAVILWLGLCALSVPLAAADGPGHAIVDLGTLPGDQFSAANDINYDGVVVGWSLGPSGQFRAFVWRAGAMAELPPLPGATSASAAAINDYGLIVGASGSEQLRAVLWKGGVPIDLGLPPGATSCSAVDVNELGQVAGSCDLETGERVGFVWQGGKMTMLPTLPGGELAYVSALNNFGFVAGGALDDAGDYRATVFQKGAIVGLGAFPGGSHSAAGGVNDRGEVVGAGETASLEPEAVLWRRGVALGLGTLPGTTWSQAVAVNDLRHVVGRSGLTPFLWQDGQMLALPTLQGGTGIGLAINNQDDIAGQADNAMGQPRAVIWTFHEGLAHDRSIVWDVGPLRGLVTPPEGAGTVIFSASDNQNFVDAVSFRRDVEVTGLNLFTSSSHLPFVGTHFRVKILADDRGVPGAPVAQFEVEPTSVTLVGMFATSGGKLTDVHRVNLKVPPTVLRANTTYWVGASGLNFDAGVYGVLGPGDGRMMMLSGDMLIGPAPPAFGDLMIQLQSATLLR